MDGAKMLTNRTPDQIGVLPSVSCWMARTARRSIRTALAAALASTALAGRPAFAQNREEVRPVFEHTLPNAEGKRIVAVRVTYPPGGKSLAHHHAGSAFVYAYVLSGSIRSQVDDAPAKVYQAGESFYELPGSHHRISENASSDTVSSLLAIFIVDSKDNPLTAPD
jgi:quercetin dioxygenase-like cupin family protein